MLCSRSSSFANASAETCLSYLSCLAVQNKSVKYKEALLNHRLLTIKLNEHISLILLNSFCHRLNHLGDFI